LVSLVGMPYVVLMPIFADQILHGGARGLGILMGATGVGALLGALTLAFRQGVKGLGRWVAWCCAGFGASLMVFALSHKFWISVILLLPVGYFMMLQMACSNTLIQVMVPDALRGRVMAVYSMMFMGMAPIGALASAARWPSTLGAPRPWRSAALRVCWGRAGSAATAEDSRGGAALIVAQAAAAAGDDEPAEMTAQAVEDSLSRSAFSQSG
jgi:MFS family permease